MSNKITGIVVIFDNGEFAVPDVNEVTVVDKATGIEVKNLWFIHLMIYCVLISVQIYMVI